MTLARRIAPVITLVAIAFVGATAAAAAGHGLAAVAFGVLGAGIAAGLPQAIGGGVTIRNDLIAWLQRTSSVTGETVDELADRAISRLRSQTESERATGHGGS